VRVTAPRVLAGRLAVLSVFAASVLCVRMVFGAPIGWDLGVWFCQPFGQVGRIGRVGRVGRGREIGALVESSNRG